MNMNEPTKCPDCGKHSIIVLMKAPFVVTGRGTHGWHPAQSYGVLTHSPVHDKFEAFCNAHNCGWQGTLKDTLSAS